MYGYLDRTFCVSPNCTNECGRQLTDEIRLASEKAKCPIACSWFCGRPEVKDNEENK